MEEWLRANSLEPIEVDYNEPRYSEPSYDITTETLKPSVVVDGALDTSTRIGVYEASPENEEISREAANKVMISVDVRFP